MLPCSDDMKRRYALSHNPPWRQTFPRSTPPSTHAQFSDCGRLKPRNQRPESASILPALEVGAYRQLAVHESDASGFRRIGSSVTGVPETHIHRRPTLLAIQAGVLDTDADDGCQTQRMPGAIASPGPGGCPGRRCDRYPHKPVSYPITRAGAAGSKCRRCAPFSAC